MSATTEGKLPAMMVLRLCVSFAAFLFFSSAGEALAQDTTYVRLKTCAEHATIKDPTIISRKSIDARYACGEGRPVKIVLVDLWYGFETTAKAVRDIPSVPRKVDPVHIDVYKTHKPCRVAYPDEGVLVEWIVPKTDECGGRDSGTYYRVYTPDGKVCIKPNGGCVTVQKLDAIAQERFRQTLVVAYQQLALSE